MTRMPDAFGEGQNSPDLHESHYFWAHATWDSNEGRPFGLNSPRFENPTQLRAWTATCRSKHGQKEGFYLHPYKHTYLADPQGRGIPGTGKDESLETKEDAAAPPWQGSKLTPTEFIKRLETSD